ncbi:hypothetical protein GCM10012289_56740 [Nonomuraea cavernae]|uniref:Uncharacterized protein n=1 Tax=Nonomuraea cavernae TaxID=2045107 RepID=A0A918DNQ9_9ACTN|nr:hypothetical protein GCM10012289_56740 [Nonomuraea cavernae]
MAVSSRPGIPGSFGGAASLGDAEGRRAGGADRADLPVTATLAVVAIATVMVMVAATGTTTGAVATVAVAATLAVVAVGSLAVVARVRSLVPVERGCGTEG